MKNCNTQHDDRTAGVISMALLAIAFLIGTYSIFKYNVLAAIIYFFIVLGGYFFNIFCFCRKCPLVKRNSCRSIIFGKIARLLPENKGPIYYTIRDIIIVWITRLFMFFFPRPWLYKEKILFTIFWCLVVSAVFLWISRSCRKCQNERCPFRKFQEMKMNLKEKKSVEATEKVVECVHV